MVRDPRKRLIRALKHARDDMVSGKEIHQVVSSLASILFDYAEPPKDPLSQVMDEIKATRPDLAHEAQVLISDHKPVLIDLLNGLLKKEYLQRDVYEQYSYLMFGPEAIAVREHLKEHMEDEMRHIETLQKYVISYGGQPTTERLPLTMPHQNPAGTLTEVMEMDVGLEADAVNAYTEAIALLEEFPAEFIPLRIDLENIVVQEQEHLMDLQRWLSGS